MPSRSKLSDKQFEDIKTAVDKGDPYSLIADRFGMTRNGIAGIVHRRGWGLGNKSAPRPRLPARPSGDAPEPAAAPLYAPDPAPLRSVKPAFAQRFAMIPDEPPRSMHDFPAAVDIAPPDRPGMLPCDGREIKREDYLGLFAAAEEMTAAAINLPSNGPALADLKAHHCRWPMGDPQEPTFHFCGDQKEPGLGSYCKEHAALAYKPQPVRKFVGKKSGLSMRNAVGRI